MPWLFPPFETKDKAKESCTGAFYNFGLSELTDVIILWLREKRWNALKIAQLFYDLGGNNFRFIFVSKNIIEKSFLLHDLIRNIPGYKIIIKYLNILFVGKRWPIVSYAMFDFSFLHFYVTFWLLMTLRSTLLKIQQLSHLLWENMFILRPVLRL